MTRPIGLKQEKRKFTRSGIRKVVAKHEQMKLDANRMAQESIAKPFKIET